MNVEIDITRRCNFACPGCDRLCNIPAANPDSEMDVGEMRRVFGELAPYRIGKLCVIGGEPTLHPDIMEACSLLHGAANAETKLLATNHSNERIVDEIRRRFPDIQIRYDNGHDLGRIRALKAENHFNILMSPQAEGLGTDGHPCGFFYGCGLNVHKHRGKVRWFWCSAGTSVAKLLGLDEELFRDSLAELLSSYADIAWRLPEVCRNCMYSARRPVRAKDEGRVSGVFAEGLRRMGCIVEKETPSTPTTGKNEGSDAKK